MKDPAEVLVAHCDALDEGAIGIAPGAGGLAGGAEGKHRRFKCRVVCL